MSETQQRGALGALVLGGIFLGCSPILVRVSHVGPIATAFWRQALALLPIALMFGRRGAGGDARSRSVGDVVVAALPGACLAGDLIAWHISLHMTSIANSTLLANLAPIFVTLGAWLLFRERVRPAFLVGMAVALGGAFVLMGQSLSFGRTHILGDALGVVTAMFYGSYIVTVSRLVGGYTTATIVTWSATATSLVLLPIALASGDVLLPHSAHGWAVLLGLALFSHAGGQSLIAYALAHLPASFSAVGLLAQPVGAAVLAWAMLAEPLGWLQALGGAIVLAGILLARRASRR